MNQTTSRETKISNYYITCSGKTDGIGAQAQAIFSTMLFAQESGIRYVHTPFISVAHDQPSEEWECFFNLGQDELALADSNVTSLPVLSVNQPSTDLEPDTLYAIPHCHSFADLSNNVNGYSRLKDKFLTKYHASSKKAYGSFYRQGKVNIAIHVRRGDVSANSFRHTDNVYYRSLLNSLTLIMDDLKTDVSIHLYSQGALDQFSDLDGLDVSYHLDECPFSAFVNMVSADILITAKSSFSYCAALLSKGIIIYEPFWHTPIDDWIIATQIEKSTETRFDKTKLKEKVHRLLGSGAQT